MVATKDYHVHPGGHFADEPDYAHSWPPHCVAGSPGADFHPDLVTEPIEAVFRKGAYAAAYSGFEGADDDGTSLADWLRGTGWTRSTSSASRRTTACGLPPRTRRSTASASGSCSA